MVFGHSPLTLSKEGLPVYTHHNHYLNRPYLTGTPASKERRSTGLQDRLDAQATPLIRSSIDLLIFEVIRGAHHDDERCA